MEGSLEDADNQVRDGRPHAEQALRRSISDSNVRHTPKQERNAPAEAVAIDIPPQRHLMLRSCASGNFLLCYIITFTPFSMLFLALPQQSAPAWRKCEDPWSAQHFRIICATSILGRYLKQISGATSLHFIFLTSPAVLRRR